MDYVFTQSIHIHTATISKFKTKQIKKEYNLQNIANNNIVHIWL